MIFRASLPRELERLLAGVQGAVRVVGTADESGLTDVYLRPPKAFLDPKSLAAVLRKRLQV